MKYMKTYEGVITGSMAGRDDGYPETKRVFYSSLDGLAKDFGKHPGEKYYELTEIDKESLKDVVLEKLEELKEEKKVEKKEKLSNEIARLQKELDSLN